MAKIKVGIIGAGAIAQHHLRVLSSFDDVEICAIVNRSPERRETAAKEFNISAQYSDFREMGRIEKLDAVFVLVSAENIFSVVKECLNWGIPIFTEKPPGLTVAETKELARIASQNKVSVMVGFNRRFYSVVKKAREAIESRGRLLGVVVEAPERIQEKRMAGKFSDKLLDQWLVLNGSHGIDLLRFIGGEIEDAHTMSSSLKERNGDTFGAIIRFTSGAIGHYVSYWQTPGRWRVDLYGDGIRSRLEPVEEGKIINEVTAKEEKSLPIEPDEQDIKFKPGFWTQARYFIDRVKDKKPISTPACSLLDAVETMKLVARIGRGEAKTR